MMRMGEMMEVTLQTMEKQLSEFFIFTSPLDALEEACSNLGTRKCYGKSKRVV